MPFQRERYPADWPAISRAIRERAGQKCEWCGVVNGAVVLRREDGTIERVYTHLWQHPQDREWYAWCEDAEGNPTSETDTWPADAKRRPVKIVLTVAHLGTAHADGRPGDKHDKMDCRPENLAALCQRCHLNYDRDEHAANAAATRAKKRRAAHEAEQARYVPMFDEQEG